MSDQERISPYNVNIINIKQKSDESKEKGEYLKRIATNYPGLKDNRNKRCSQALRFNYNLATWDHLNLWLK